MGDEITNPHPLFEQYEVDRVGKLQVRDIKNARLFDLASTVTRPEIVDILKRDHGAGKYTVHPFELNGRQMGGAFIIEIEPIAGQVVGGGEGVAVAERALNEERRRLADERKAIVEAETRLENQRRNLEQEQYNQVKDLLKQQGEMMATANTRAQEMMEDTRKRAEALIKDARDQAEDIRKQAEDRGRRAADDVRLDADNYHKRAVNALDVAERKLAAAEAYEKRILLETEQRRRQVEAEAEHRRRQIETEVEQAKQALAERRLQMERENLEFRLKVQDDQFARKIETVTAQFQTRLAVTLPEEMQAAKAQIEIDRERAQLKKDYPPMSGIKDFMEYMGPTLAPLVEAFMAARQPQQAPQAQPQQAHHQIGAEAAPAQTFQPDLPPQVTMAAPPVVDLRSLVGYPDTQAPVEHADNETAAA